MNRSGLLAALTSILVVMNMLTLQAQHGSIHLNQTGFFDRGVKEAVLTGDATDGLFHLIRAGKGDTVLTARPGPLLSSRNSSLKTRIISFTEIAEPGLYRLSVPGMGLSVALKIGRDVFRGPANAALKGFYYQRVSMPLDQKYAGKWHRPAGHPDTAVSVHPSAVSIYRPAGTVIPSPGGWYDAGDYNKYIVNSGITMGTLLSAYEDFRAYFDTLRTDIPESGNGLPDLLDEVLCNLRWMLTMQDIEDGGVYHKCTNAAFDGMVMPGVTTLPRYVVMKSTAAALDFTAVMAQSARVFSRFEKQLPGLSDSCMHAANRAWEWAVEHPAVIYDQDALNRKFQPAITTGSYGDGNLADEWFWAAAELYATTRQEMYRIHIDNGLSLPMKLVSWNSVSMAGYYSLARMEKNIPMQFIPVHSLLKRKIRAFADSLLGNAGRNAFHVTMGGSPRDFEWGSNAVAANQGIALLNAYRISGDRKYLFGAIANADHILGRNATGYCFLTGFGTKSPMHPHHRPSVADGIADPVPGLLCGGPNPGRQDGCTYAFTEPETSYVDDDCSYASNEIAINWNAPLVYLLQGIQCLMNR